MRPDAYQSVIQKINYLLFFILQSLSFTNKVLVNLFYLDLDKRRLLYLAYGLQQEVNLYMKSNMK